MNGNVFVQLLNKISQFILYFCSNPIISRGITSKWVRGYLDIASVTRCQLTSNNLGSTIVDMHDSAVQQTVGKILRLSKLKQIGHRLNAGQGVGEEALIYHDALFPTTQLAASRGTVCHTCGFQHFLDAVGRLGLVRTITASLSQ